MSGVKRALLVGCPQYEDLSFPRLPAVDQDIMGLARVLEDPEIGDFTVSSLLGGQSQEIEVEIDKFFAGCKPDDLLLLYFSCHGVLDPRRQLYFVANNTKKHLLDSTGISARWVKERMDGSRSRRIVLLLDCCYSGAFTRSPGRERTGAQEILVQLSGHGRVVITASNKTEFAYESKFTDAVVQGLQTGAADLDGDGRVSVVELYDYVFDQVRQSTQGQTPTMSSDDVCGQLYLAKNPHTPLPLPPMVEQVFKRPKDIRERLWVVESLRHLLADDHPGGLKLTARKSLESLRKDDPNRSVRKAAGTALGAASRHVADTGDKSQKYRRIVAPLASLVVVFVLVALAGKLFWPAVEDVPFMCSRSAKSADGVLSLGTLLPKTGQFVYTGPPLDAGVHLAMKDINDSGGIPGIFLNFDQANQRDEGNPSAGTASQSTDVLLPGGVDAIIGPATSATAINIIDKVTCAGVIMFSPSNTSPLFTNYLDHGLYFRTVPSSEFEGTALGRLVGNQTAVVMSRDDAYGNPLREQTTKAIQKSGGRVLDSFHYDPNAADYDQVIQRVKEKNPDAIVLIGFNESAKILAGMIKNGLGPRVKRVYGSTANITTTLAGQVSPRDPSTLAGMQGLLPDVGDEEFVRRLRANSPGLQDLTYAAQAYDAVVITALAAAVANTDEPAAMAKEIDGVTKDGEKCTSFAACMTLVRAHKNIYYVGPSGPLEFTEPGEPSQATYVISEIQENGTIKSLGRTTG